MIGDASHSNDLIMYICIKGISEITLYSLQTYSLQLWQWFGKFALSTKVTLPNIVQINDLVGKNKHAQK